jgi:hypothetical protein
MKRILLFVIVIAGLVQLACKKNSSGGGQPVVKDVRSVTPAEADSFFTSALPGTLIVIQGSGFSGLQAVYFNDTAADFNPVYATNTNIIVTIPATAQTAATNPNVPSLIKIVTSHGTVTYPFTLYIPSPVINAIALDNTGTILYITGTNLQAIQKITFPIGSSSDTATSWTVNSTFTQITAGVPTGTVHKDSVRVYCIFGTGSFPYPPPAVIASVSNENGLAGDTLTITGSNFIGISQVLFPGGIAGIDLQVQNYGQLTVVVPSGITAPDSLRVQGIVGTSASPQLFDSYITHPSPGYLSTFDAQNATDNTGFIGWTGGYASAPATAYPNATGSVAYFQNAGSIAGNTSPGSQGNPGFIQLNAVPWVSNTGASVANYSLKFEVYVAQPWSAGAIWVMMGGWYGWQGYLARYAPWSTAAGGIYQPSGWVTVTIPLTQFVTTTGAGTSVLDGGKVASPNGDANEWDYQTFPTGGVPASTFANYGSTALCFTIVNDQASPSVAAGALNIAIDNVRIVQGQ